jgi:hypothetical protein
VPETLDANQKEIVRSGDTSQIRLRMGEKIFRPGTKEKFVAVNDALGVEDRLTSEEFFQRLLLSSGTCA